MASEYNLRPRPTEVVIIRGSDASVRDRTVSSSDETATCLARRLAPTVSGLNWQYVTADGPEPHAQRAAWAVCRPACTVEQLVDQFMT